MEAGYDFLLLRGRLQRNFLTSSGLFLLVFGAVLLAGGGGFYLYAAHARANLAKLNLSLAGDIKVTTDAPLANPSDSLTAIDPVEVAPPPGIPASAISSQKLFPSESPLTDWWSDPLSYEPLEYKKQALLQGFTPMSTSQALPLGSQPPATRIMIPDINVDSAVNQLKILDLDESRAYETPANTVGHIPEVANVGEAGSAWFFAHLESPLVGEGSVFYNLPRIPDILRDGEDVFIITGSGARQYLYRVISTEVVPEDEMRLYNTGWAAIHLVACVPRLVYDHRLIVTGELVGVK